MAITLSGDGIARANLAADVIDSTKLADDAVNSEHYVDASIDNAHLADDAVGVAELSATGTASSSTYLRGDNSWATVTSVGGATGVDFNDNVKARFGTGNDLEIFHDGSHTYIQDVGTGNLRLRGQQIEIYNPDGSESLADFNVDGAVNLYHNGSKKFETTSAGVTVTGAIAGATNLGKVLSFHRHELTGQSNTTSTSWVDTNSITMTPASGSTLLFIHTINVGLSYSSGVALRIRRDGTTTLKNFPGSVDSDAGAHFIYTAGASGTMIHGSHTATYSYAHGGNGSTSMAFTTQRRMTTSSNTSYFQYYSAPSSLIIIEIGA